MIRRCFHIHKQWSGDTRVTSLRTYVLYKLFFINTSIDRCFHMLGYFTLLAHIHKGTAISVLRSVNQFTTLSTRPTRLPLCNSPVTAYASPGYTTVSRDSTQCEDHHDRMKCSVDVNNLSSYTSTQVELCVVITTHHGTDLSWHLPWLPATAGSVS